MQFYTDPSREQDSHSLPDAEVFYVDPTEHIIGSGERRASGWYYWFCSPGCLPDSEEFGPYDSKMTAVDAAMEDNS